MDIIKKLNTRSSVKLFDKNKKVSEEDMNTILESLRLAPSSYGLQGWKFVVVSNPDIKKEIETHSNNQKQIADAPDLIVLCYIKDLSENHVDKYIHEISTKRNVPLPELLGFKNIVMSKLSDKPQADKWLQNQVYIALGFLMYTCAMLDIDCCPIEGFDKQKCDQILGLEKLGLASVVLCPIGYRADTETYSKMPKIRFPKQDLFIFIK